MSEQQQDRSGAFALEAHMVRFHDSDETAALIAQARVKRAELEREEREAETVRGSGGGKLVRVENLSSKGGSFRGGKSLPGAPSAAKSAPGSRSSKQATSKIQRKG